MYVKANRIPNFLLLLTPALLVLAISLACAGATPTPTSSGSEASASTAVSGSGSVEATSTTPPATEEPTATEAQPVELFLGDTVEKYGYSLTGVQVIDPAPPGMFYQPETGKKLVAVDVVIGNISGDPISVNPLNATLVDTEGFTYQAELGGTDEQLGTVDLMPGERVKGQIAFKVPENAGAGKIKYNISIFGNDTLQANLTPAPTDHSQVAGSFVPAPTIEIPKLGETAEEQGYSLSVTSVKDPAQPGMLYSPKEGTKLVGAELILGNVSGSEALSVNPLYAYLVDKDGYIYGAELAGMDSQLDVVDLAVGEKVKGWVSFTLPKDAVPSYIKYQLSPFGNTYLISGAQ